MYACIFIKKIFNEHSHTAACSRGQVHVHVYIFSKHKNIHTYMNLYFDESTYILI